jgi:hypothetical protein
MAMGKKSGGKDWAKGRSGNPAGRKKLPEDVKQIKAMRKSDLDIIFTRHSVRSLNDLVEFLKNGENPALEMLVARVMIEGIKKGDHQKMDALLNRMIGKVKEQVDVNHSGTLHTNIMQMIEDAECSIEKGEEYNAKEESSNKESGGD